MLTSNIFNKGGSRYFLCINHVPLLLIYVCMSYVSKINCFEFFSCNFIFRSRQGQIGEEIFDMLTSFTDFLAFKQMMLDYKFVSLVTGVSTFPKINDLFVFYLTDANMGYCVLDTKNVKQ